MTENEFVRRYHAVTGSDELDPVEHGRRKPFVIGGAIAVAAGGAALATGLVVWLTAGSHKAVRHLHATLNSTAR